MEVEIMVECFISTDDLTRKYKVSRQAVYEWRKLGLPFYKFSARNILYKEQEVEKWLKENKNNRKGIGAIK